MCLRRVYLLQTSAVSLLAQLLSRSASLVIRLETVFAVSTPNPGEGMYLWLTFRWYNVPSNFLIYMSNTSYPFWIYVCLFDLVILTAVSETHLCTVVSPGDGDEDKQPLCWVLPISRPHGRVYHFFLSLWSSCISTSTVSLYLLLPAWILNRFIRNRRRS